ncbi:MAG: methyltransferase domain-containing protein [Planctomycetes bacterium]|nr:methyltransferase domain-containing protein [Planctomycetota bacterium]
MTNSGLIDPVCPVCGESASQPYAEENGFHLVRCKECTLLYVTPRPDPDATAVAHQYGMHHGDTTIAVTGRYRPARIRTYLGVLRDIYGRSLPAGLPSWVDIGCGYGEFLAALRAFGGTSLSLIGLEPNVLKAGGCVSRGLDVRTCTLGDLPGTFSAISLRNVFSHLQDPKVFLRECVARLEPGGELLLETGDTAHFPPKQHPRPLYLPDHLLFGNEAIIRRVFRDLSLDVVSVHTYFAVSAILWQVLNECKLALQARRMPRLLDTLRRWARERGRKIDMYVRARKLL